MTNEYDGVEITTFAHMPVFTSFLNLYIICIVHMYWYILDMQVKRSLLYMQCTVYQPYTGYIPSTCAYGAQPPAYSCNIPSVITVYIQYILSIYSVLVYQYILRCIILYTVYSQYQYPVYIFSVELLQFILVYTVYTGAYQYTVYILVSICCQVYTILVYWGVYWVYILQYCLYVYNIHSVYIHTSMYIQYTYTPVLGYIYQGNPPAQPYYNILQAYIYILQYIYIQVYIYQYLYLYTLQSIYICTPQYITQYIQYI